MLERHICAQRGLYRELTLASRLLPRACWRVIPTPFANSPRTAVRARQAAEVMSIIRLIACLQSIARIFRYRWVLACADHRSSAETDAATACSLSDVYRGRCSMIVAQLDFLYTSAWASPSRRPKAVYPGSEVPRAQLPARRQSCKRNCEQLECGTPRDRPRALDPTGREGSS
jgi:hypothetical protein